MTTSQRTGYYFPAWARCRRALGWDFRPPAARRPSHGHGLANELYQRVWDTASTLALGEFRSVNAADLRHACNFVSSQDLQVKSAARIALGHRAIPGARGARSGSGAFSTAETNHVVRLFRALAEPDNLEIWIEWNSPEESDRRSVLASLLRRADEAYISHIARDRFGRRVPADPTDIEAPHGKILEDWQSLPMEQLRDLLAVVVQRNRQHRTVHD